MTSRDTLRAAIAGMLAAAPALMLAAAPVSGLEVAIPLSIDLPFLRQRLVEQVYTEPDESADVWRDGHGCGWLELGEPVLDAADGRLRITSRGRARLGHSFGNRCLGGLRWQGFVELLVVPELDPGATAVRFAVVDSLVYDEGRRDGTPPRLLWDLVKRHAHPRLGRWRIDLAEPVGALRDWLPEVLTGDDRIRDLTDSLALREPRVGDEGIVVTLAFRVEPLSPPPPSPEPPAPPDAVELDPDELVRWQQRWQRWDAFLTHAIKRFASELPGELRRDLVEVLLDARHDLTRVLTPPRPGAPDPVPALFVRSWEQLAPLLRTSAGELPGARALRYLSFIAAGDTLVALERLGPEIGLDVSADGLRRLARTIDPLLPVDPVAYDVAIDVELRSVLGLGAPLPRSSPRDDPTLARFAPLDWLFPAAWAELDPDARARLNRWVPSHRDLDAYLPLVRELLLEAQHQVVETSRLAREHHSLYRHLVLATAWQESCWRQFIERDQRRVPLLSKSGSAGIMQVNQHVWRGVYEVDGLLGDIGYNARAGSEILRHYLVDYAIRRGADELPRATYLLYNGGPRQLARQRTDPHPRVTRVIDAFLKKYRAVRAGRELEVARCFGVRG